MTKPFRRVLVKLSGEALTAPDGYWLHPQTLSGARRGHRGGDEGRLRDRARRRRRQHHPRRAHERRRLDRPRHRRFDGHAGDGDELARPRDGAQRRRRLGADHVGRLDADDLRDLCPPAGAALSRPRPGRGARRRHRQSVLHHRHLGGAARRRAALRRGAQGDAGRRRLFRRPEDRPAAPSATTASPTTRRSPGTCKVMDTAAFALARESRLPVIVGSIHAPSSVTGILEGATPRRRRS